MHGTEWALAFPRRLGLGDPGTMVLTRRDVLMAGPIGGVVLASALLSSGHAEPQQEDDMAVIARLVGRTPTPSDRVHLVMPAKFPTGYTVPMDLDVDSPMTEVDHVKRIRVFAPKNPIVEVASFNFVPRRSTPRVSTRIRLAKPQDVVAVAEMSDGTLLMSKAWVDVATDGCA
jgi:sulfur-oxidizing protein SoxY